MTPSHVRMHHDPAARFRPYRPEDPLTHVFAFADDMPEGFVAAYITGRTFRMCNAAREVPEHDHAAPDAGLVFPPAYLYRPLRLRPPSAGDIVPVRAQGHTMRLVCTPFDWPSTTPAHISGRAPATDTVHQHLRTRQPFRRLRGNDA